VRRSELAGLDYAQVGDGDRHHRLTAEAVEIVLLRQGRTEPATVFTIEAVAALARHKSLNVAQK
jgi:hypothetical protein